MKWSRPASRTAPAAASTRARGCRRSTFRSTRRRRLAAPAGRGPGHVEPLRYSPSVSQRPRTLPVDASLPPVPKDNVSRSLVVLLQHTIRGDLQSGRRTTCPEATMFDIPYRKLGSTGERVSAIGLGGWHLGARRTWTSRWRRASCAPRSTAASRSWTTAGTTTTARARRAWGKRAARRLPRQGLPHDEDRRPLAKEATRQLDESLRAAADRLHRPRAAPRDHPLRGPAPHLRRGRRATPRSSSAQKAGKLRFIGFTGHKDPRIHLHMLEVAERARASASTRCRCRST